MRFPLLSGKREPVHHTSLLTCSLLISARTLNYASSTKSVEPLSKPNVVLPLTACGELVLHLGRPRQLIRMVVGHYCPGTSAFHWLLYVKKKKKLPRILSTMPSVDSCSCLRWGQAAYPPRRERKVRRKTKNPDSSTTQRNSMDKRKT